MNFNGVAQLFSTVKNPSKGKPTGDKATRIFMRSADSFALRFYDTDIITWYMDGRIVLDDGGHTTMTTYRRMNDYTPHSIGVTRSAWKPSIIYRHGVTNVYDTFNHKQWLSDYVPKVIEKTFGVSPTYNAWSHVLTLSPYLDGYLSSGERIARDDGSVDSNEVSA